jgi:hypothetical protein
VFKNRISEATIWFPFAYPRTRLFNTYRWFAFKNRISAATIWFPFAYSRTRLFNTYRWFAFKNHIRGNVFSNSLPRDAYMSQYFNPCVWNTGMGFRYKQIVTYQRKDYDSSRLINICASASVTPEFAVCLGCWVESTC